MGRSKTPVAVLRENGSKHYSKDALDEREAAEVAAPESENIPIPAVLRSKKLKDEFRALAPVLRQMGVLSDVDVDNLARYVVARNEYDTYCKRVAEAIKTGTVDEVEKWSKLQDRAFKQCRAAASDVGLTVNARANILLPKAPEALDPAEADMFG